jgi:hypothetical protein
VRYLSVAGQITSLPIARHLQSLGLPGVDPAALATKTELVAADFGHYSIRPEFKEAVAQALLV